jgi:hypothetical protein
LEDSAVDNSHRSQVRAIAGLVIVSMFVVGDWSGGSRPQATAAEDVSKADQSLKVFMRKKLDASSQILEGLTIEDAELIKTGANALTELSKAERWQILTDADYREYSREFRNNARKVAEAAEAGNFDKAAFQWFGTMKTCIDCHQHVRHPDANDKKK